MIEFIKHINFFEWLKFYKTSEKDDFNKNYRPVEYLQSDGNQYIITPFYYDEGGAGTAPIYNIKCRCCIDDIYSIFGMNNSFILLSTTAGRMRFFGYTEKQKITTDIHIGTELNNWELLNKNLYCNGIIQNSTPDYFNNTYGFGGGDYVYLFCRTGPEDSGGNCKISNFYVSAKDPDTGTVTEICDLVACIRKSDNKPGMYDKVSQTFLTNQGTGEFTVPV